MTTNALHELLSAPLDPDWTIDGLAERILAAVAAHPDSREIVLDADALTDRQPRRLLRPLLACLATKSAADLYGGPLAFQRSGPCGSVWVLGSFENRPGQVRLALRRSDSAPVTPLPAGPPRDQEVSTSFV